MNHDDVERQILELLTDDAYGLWEIGWHLRATLGVDPLRESLELGLVVESMRKRHLVDLYMRQGEGDPQEISTTRPDIGLHLPSAWIVPEEGEPQLWLG